MAGPGALSALVTGGGSGIGQAVALRLSEQGYDVTVADLSLEGALQTAAMRRASGGQVVAVQCDVTDSVRLREVFGEHEKRFGGLDLVVNNAGIAENTPFFEDDETKSNWRQVIDVDLAAVLEGTKLAVAAMRRPHSGGRLGGVVVNVASAAGVFPLPFQPVYSAVKAAVVMLSRCLAPLAHDPVSPIAVRAFCPQFVDTPFVDASLRAFGAQASKEDLLGLAGGRLLSLSEAASCLVDMVALPEPEARLESPVLVLTPHRGSLWWSFDRGSRKR
eukprot:CAMPEP_0118997806 /NCGR_PEP_ID=MMETSP1173-20130426/62436_1 /TAXON_ID=1034831 /ORGANISM="Rhizochromulina marina cf, Strain CCMP1243" /LENGTH=274 /DNA_ID=CAMNT_0006949269 /DNA_START=105 /DNA_END=925 /DNA_ORIENTATION=-